MIIFNKMLRYSDFSSKISNYESVHTVVRCSCVEVSGLSLIILSKQRPTQQQQGQVSSSKARLNLLPVTLIKSRGLLLIIRAVMSVRVEGGGRRSVELLPSY